MNPENRFDLTVIERERLLEEANISYIPHEVLRLRQGTLYWSDDITRLHSLPRLAHGAER